MRFSWCCWVAAAAVVSSAGCDEDEGEVHEIEDEGTVCFVMGPADTLLVRVEFPTCLSSSCDTVLDKSCSVEQSGGDLFVRASTSIETRGGNCTADCRVVSADCSLPGLATGDYTLNYGTRQAAINTSQPEGTQYYFQPGDGPPICATTLQAPAASP